MPEDTVNEDLGYDVLDLVDSLGVYKAYEAGAFGNTELETEEIGSIGSAISDVQNVVVKLLTGELTIQETFEEIKTVATAVASVFLENAMKIGAEAVAIVLKVKIPILAPVIDTAKVWLQQRIPQFAKKTVETVKELGKKAINWLFG